MVPVQYRMIPLKMILRHPENPNRLAPEDRARIKDSIEKSGLYPTLVVRSLEASQELKDEHSQGYVQALDGHQRCDIIADCGATEVRCEVWPNVTDTSARLYILNLNDGGEDDPKARQALLLRVQKEMDSSLEEMERLVRETGPELQKLAELAQSPGGGAGVGVGGNVRGNAAKAMQLFAMPEHEEIITAAIERAKAEGISVDDPSGVSADGAALAGICKRYIESSAS